VPATCPHRGGGFLKAKGMRGGVGGGGGGGGRVAGGIGNRGATMPTNPGERGFLFPIPANRLKRNVD